MFFLFTLLAQAEETIWIEGEDASTHDFQDHPWWYNNVNQDLLSPGIPGVVEGDWLLHYNLSDNAPTAQAAYPFEVTEGGEYEVWLRVITPYTEGWISVDSGNQIDLEIDANIRERVNLIWPSPFEFGSWCQIGDWCVIHHSIGWVKAGTFELSAGQHTLTYGVESHSNWESGGVVGGLDAIAIFNHPWGPSGAAQPEPSSSQSDPSDWFAFHPKDSPEDWADSVFYVGNESPAGQHGAAQQQGADVVFEDGTPVKFWGVGGGPPANEDRMRQQAEFFEAMGINLVRIHPVQYYIGNPIDADLQDQFDLWFSILKEHGIYMQWSIFYPHRITEDDGYSLFAELDNGSTSGLVTVFPELQAYEWNYLEGLMTHTNPYTGMKYVDDPALAIVEVRNEDSIFFHNPLANISSIYPQHTAILQSDWADWLTEKYGSDTELFNAWGDGVRNGDSLSNPAMGIYHSWQMPAEGPLNGASQLVENEAPRLGDWIQFLSERQCDGYNNRREELRGVGYKGIVLSTGWKVGGQASAMANLWTDNCLEMIDRHTYQGGGDYLRGGSIITDDGDDSDDIPGEVSHENAHQVPGQGVLNLSHMQVENKPMQHSEWIASVPSPWKADSVPTYAFYGMGLYGWDAGLNFTAGSKFSYEGGWPELSMWAIMTPHHLGQYPAVSRAVRERHLSEGSPAHAERFSESEVFTGKDERVEYDPWLGAVGPIVKSFDGGTSETLNLFDYTEGDFINSITGELAWNINGWYKILAEKSQGVVGQAGPGSISLSDIEVELTTPFVSLLFTSLDGRTISESGSILITAMAQDKQTGTIYNSDQTQIIALGGPPLLMEPVQASLTFGGEPIVEVQILDEHGVPRGVVDGIEGNTFQIDGRWETAWYHVVRDVSEDLSNDNDTGSDDDITNNGDTGNTVKDSTGCGCATNGDRTGYLSLLSMLGWIWWRRKSHHTQKIA